MMTSADHHPNPWATHYEIRHLETATSHPKTLLLLYFVACLEGCTSDDDVPVDFEP